MEQLQTLVFFNPLLVDRIVGEIEKLVCDDGRATSRFMRDTVYGTKIGDDKIGDDGFKKGIERLWDDITSGRDNDNPAGVCTLRWTDREFRYIVYGGEDDKVTVQRFLGAYLNPTMCGKEKGMVYENPKTNEKVCIAPGTCIVCVEDENKETDFVFFDKDTFWSLFSPKLKIVGNENRNRECF